MIKEHHKVNDDFRTFVLQKETYEELELDTNIHLLHYQLLQLLVLLINMKIIILAIIAVVVSVVALWWSDDGYKTIQDDYEGDVHF